MGNTVHRYSYDGWNVIEEEIFTDENNNDILDGDEYITQRRNFIDTGMDNHIAMEQFSSDGTATMYYFITDKRGNIEALMDDTGTVLERYHHTVYGTETTVYDADYVALDCSDEEPCHFGDTHTFGWSGSTYEPETDLYWMRNRYYHPDMKRFINQDPIGIWGDANNLGNGFAYVAGMVVDHGDPTGLKVEPDKAAHSGVSTDGNFDSPADFWVLLGNTCLEALSNAGLLHQPDKGKILNLFKVKDVFVRGIIHSMEKKELENAETEEEREKIREKYRKLREKHGVESENNNEKEKEKEEAEEEEAEEEEAEEEEETEEEEDTGDSSDSAGTGSGMPSDPYNDSQNDLMKKMLRSMLVQLQDRSSLEKDPVISIDVKGPTGAPRRIFIRNPFYRAKDPMQKIFWKTKNADGTKGFIRNPLAPKAKTLQLNTYDKFEEAGFVQPEVDPYWK